MKTPLIKGFLVVGLGALLSNWAAAELPATVSVGATADPAQLPYGVTDVVKLSHAQVSEEIIVTYIQNARTGYHLQPNDIVYLKEQGVSDRVVGVMLDQSRRVVETASAQPSYPPAQTAPSASVTAPLTPPANYAYDAAPASTVYTIPYPSATYAYYGSYGYPYYSYPYYSSCYPYYRYPYYNGCYGYGGYRYGGHYGGYYGSSVVAFRSGYGGNHSYAHGGSFAHGGNFGHSSGHFAGQSGGAHSGGGHFSGGHSGHR